MILEDEKLIAALMRQRYVDEATMIVGFAAAYRIMELVTGWSDELIQYHLDVVSKK